MLRTIIPACLLLGVLAFLGEEADAQAKKKKGPPFIAAGRPPGDLGGRAARYYLWFEDKAWHLRTSTAKVKHRFQGTIQVAGGGFTSVGAPKLEALGPNADKFILNAARTAIAFEFDTDGGLDGINFQVSPGSDQIAFTLAIDGQAAPGRIFVGKKEVHPPGVPFTLSAWP